VLSNEKTEDPEETNRSDKNDLTDAENKITADERKHRSQTKGPAIQNVI
jgi:hypothetical protein